MFRSPYPPLSLFSPFPLISVNITPNQGMTRIARQAELIASYLWFREGQNDGVEGEPGCRWYASRVLISPPRVCTNINQRAPWRWDKDEIPLRTFVRPIFKHR